MDIIFWQNILSIHQAPLIRELASRFHVLVVAEKKISNSRAAAGWEIPDMGKAKLLISPTRKEIDNIIQKTVKATHIFTGISAFPMVYSAFQHAVHCGARIIVHMEPYETSGWKSVLRFMHYTYLRIKYAKHISAILATGKTGVYCYKTVGFNPKTIYEWGYFTETSTKNSHNQKNTKCQILFVGQLVPRKTIIPFIQSFIQLRDSREAELCIIGNGGQKEELLKLIQCHSNIRYEGSVPNASVADYMSHADLLVLPSRHDGWGAVVNEALLCGTRVLCSSACGASCLIDGNTRGSVFSWKKNNDLENHLNRWITSGPLSPEERSSLSLWAKKHISAKSAADYLSSIIDHITNKTNLNKPLPPWY